MENTQDKKEEKTLTLDEKIKALEMKKLSHFAQYNQCIGAIDALKTIKLEQTKTNEDGEVTTGN